MNYKLPQPSASALLIQCLLMLTFAVCLYLFLSAFQTRQNYDEAILRLEQEKQNLGQAAEQLERYRHFVATEHYYQRSNEVPKWEKIDEQWVELPYDQLLQRLFNLYSSDRPFVLDYFSAEMEGDQAEKPPLSAGAGAGAGIERANRQEKALVFHLQGYFLCPCN